MKDITTEEAVKGIKKEIDNLKVSIEGFKRDVEDELYLKKIVGELEYDIAIRDKVLNELEKKDKIIDTMALQLSGISIWDDQKEEVLILMTEEEVKEYFERMITDGESNN